jgi:hypothetical protein
MMDSSNGVEKMPGKKSKNNQPGKYDTCTKQNGVGNQVPRLFKLSKKTIQNKKRNKCNQAFGGPMVAAAARYNAVACSFIVFVFQEPRGSRSK